MSSYWLYSISLPDKCGMPQMDLSDDSEANMSIENSLLAPKERAINMVITKLFTKFHCNVRISKRLRSLFISKLYRMGKTLHSLGGSQGKTKTLDKWRETNWVVNLEGDEIIPYPNKKGEKDSIVIVSSKTKCKKLKQNLKELDEKLKDVTNKCELLEESNKKLLLECNKGDAHNKRKRKKSWSEYSIQYKKKKLKSLATNITETLKCADDDFVHQRVEMKNTETGEIITVENQGGKPVIKSKEVNKESEDTLLKKTLYIKDKYNISNEAYHELAMTNPEIPSSYRVLKTVKEINSESIITSTPGKAIGIQQSLKERLTKRLHHLRKVNPKFQQSIIQVKITGDGTYVSRGMHILVIAFTLVNVNIEECPNSPRGNHVLALINTTEDYDNIEEAVQDIADEIKFTDSITIDDFTFKMEYYLGGDWKFLAICLGLKAANAFHSCIWCKCPSDKRHDLDKKWSLTNSEEGARSIEEIKKLCKFAKKRGVETYGCVREPLFPSMAVDHVVPDILHLVLRITDVMINLLIFELRRLDSIHKKDSGTQQFMKIF